MNQEQALKQLSPQHRAIVERMLSEAPAPLDPDEKAALDEFVLFLRKDEP